MRAVVQPSDGTSPAILEALGLDLMQAQVVYPSNAQVTIAWRVYTNGDLDTKTSVKRVYASRQHAQNTNLVWLGQMGSKVFTIPHNPILMSLPSDEGDLELPVGSVIYSNGEGYWKAAARSH